MPRITTDFDNDSVAVISTIVTGDLRNLVSRFTAVNESLAAIHIKAKYFYISLICTHVPTEDKDDTTKDAFKTNLKFCITDALDPI